MKFPLQSPPSLDQTQASLLRVIEAALSDQRPHITDLESLFVAHEKIRGREEFESSDAWSNLLSLVELILPMAFADYLAEDFVQEE